MNGLLLSADAAAAAGSATGSGIIIVLYILIFGVFIYFMMIKPQKKEQKRIAAMYQDMEIGDTVVTTSGFYGVLIDITDDSVIVEFGSNKNCRIPMEKSAIKQIEKANAEE
ncbi:MAG: preprotein translocase subunit YajC [Lachnospiraceae bacterium]|nr:preprotein translocase subunit YajC [Lachnospiraceae bacterium]MBP5414241.1 preprotein translocase subunit YajC [Lachnospiraceae bacterium]MBP5744855.1 preprotein translocase subunit YajC [Lachnospiraceae bacterium]